ncbi:hypothetical protein ACSBR2_001321 [Camellia fascicularis]
MAKPSDGGWQPVVRRHGGRGVWNSRTNVSIHSVFVDNLPEAMRAKGLYSIFSNYGVVVDTFIPNKRRKMTRFRFGFVRYNCSVAANMAIQKANGLWCDDKALKVKMADYGKEYGTKHKAGPSMQTRKFAEEPNRTHVGYQDRGSMHEEGDDHVIVEAHDSRNIMVEEDQLRDTSVVAESDLQKGMSDEIGYVCQESSTYVRRALQDC